MPKPTDALLQLEDTLQDMRALTKLVLFATENGDDEEFGRLRETVCTQMYMMMDKLAVCESSHKAAWLSSASNQNSGDNLH
ncbi:hypothetical protein [Rhizobium sp. SGZ-381]|uniref:hypothetical protein n=1 Tax=Rhizobium sp. SGZ-381 TaxID=3342800 RepID=UPI00366D67C3